MGSFTLTSLLDELARQEVVVGLFLMGAGLVFLLMGRQMFQILVAISFGVVGFVLGGLVPIAPDLSLMCCLGGAVLLAGLSMLLTKVAVGALAGGWAGVSTLGMLSSFDLPDEVLYAVCAVAVALAVSLTLIMFQEMIVAVTSFEGAILVLSGGVVFSNQYPMFWRNIRDLLVNTPIFVPFLVIAITVTGFFLQLSQLRQKDSGMSV